MSGDNPVNGGLNGPHGGGAQHDPLRAVVAGDAWRTGVVAGAALVSALLSGFVLAGAEFPHVPRRAQFGPPAAASGAWSDVGWAPWEWLLRVSPGLGLLVAAGVCGALYTLRRPMPVRPRVVAWTVALAGAVLLAVLVPVVRTVSGAGGHAGARAGLAVAAGIVLGAASQGARGRRWGLPMLVGGAAVACALAHPAAVTWAMDTITGGSSAFLASGGADDSGSWWWPVALVVVLIAAALTVEAFRPDAVGSDRVGSDRVGSDRAGGDRAGGDRAAGDAPADAAGGPAQDARVPARRRGLGAAGVLALLAAGGFGLYALARAGDGWAVMAAGLALTVALFGVCGALLGETGTILPAALATTVAAGPLVAEVTDTMILGLPVVLAFVVLGIASAVAGVRWPSPGLGFSLLVLVGVLGIVSFGDPQTLTVFRLLVTAVGGAYLLTSSLVLHCGTRPLPGAVPWTRSGAGTRSRVTPAVLGGAALFLTSGPAALADLVSAQARGPMWIALDDAGPPGASVGVGVAMTLTLLGCAIAYAVLAVRHRFRDIPTEG